MPVPYKAAKVIYDNLNNAVDAASRALNALPGLGSGPMGLTPDAIKFGPEYCKLKADYDRVASASRAYNRHFCKQYKAELAADRAAARSAVIARNLAHLSGVR